MAIVCCHHVPNSCPKEEYQKLDGMRLQSSKKSRQGAYYWWMPFSACCISNSSKHLRERPMGIYNELGWALQKLKLFASSSCLPSHKMGFLLCVSNGIGWDNANWLTKSLFDEVIGKGPVAWLPFLPNHRGPCLPLAASLWMILIDLQMPQAAEWDLLKNCFSCYRIKIRWEF